MKQRENLRVSFQKAKANVAIIFVDGKKRGDLNYNLYQASEQLVLQFELIIIRV
jgi:hypothetical protein